MSDNVPEKEKPTDIEKKEESTENEEIKKL